jgi:hypothetical protein
MREGFKEDEAGAMYILDILTLVALVLSVGAIGYTIANPAHDGLQGIQGMQGINGTNGMQGEQGLQGIQGIQGLQGTQGIPGVPEHNYKPVLSNVTTTGYYRVVTVLGNTTYDFVFNISGKAYDDDNDTVQTIIYSHNSTSTLWTPAYVFFKINKTISTSVTYTLVTPSNQRIYWAVMLWDGRDINVYYFDKQTLYP